MKLTTSAGQLADLLGRVARAASARSTTPILQGVLFRAHKGEGAAGSLTMSATDMEISLTLSASAPVEAPGKAVVPAKVLLQYAKNLPAAAEVVLEAGDGGTEATLSSGKSSMTLRCYPAQDYPTPPAFTEEGAFSVPAGKLAASVEKVLPFVSRDESRPVLTGVLVEFAEDAARLVATDSYRLGVEETALAGAKGDGNGGARGAIVPARALKEAARLAALGTETVEISLTENACAFSVGGGALVLTTRLIEGTYPEYRRLLPDAFEHTFRAEREELRAALARVGLLAGESPPTPVTLRFAREGGTLGEGEVHISLRNNDRGGAAAEAVPASVPEGTDFSACFNPSYLADAVASTDAPALDFCFNGPLKPAVVRAHDPVHSEARDGGAPNGGAGAGGGAGGKDAAGHLCMIMPMRDPSRKG